MLDHLPLVSVIIPNYNHSNCLQARITSILDQTYSNIEIILLDDCSTDNSREELLKYKDHKLVTHIVFNDTNSGSPFKQWQKGIKLSRGEWIWIAESDDYCEKTFLEVLIQGILKGHDVCLAYCQSVMFNKNQVTDRTFYPLLEDNRNGIDWIGGELFGRNNLSNASMAIFKKDVLEKIDYSFLNFKFCGDWFFWLQVARHGRVYISGKYLNYYNKHSNNVSNKAWINGLYYAEGQVIMKYIISDIGLSDDQKAKGLTVFVNQFVNDESQFASKEVRDLSWKSLMSIDESAIKKIYKNIKRRRQIESIKKSLKGLLN